MTACLYFGKLLVFNFNAHCASVQLLIWAKPMISSALLMRRRHSRSRTRSIALCAADAVDWTNVGQWPRDADGSFVQHPTELAADRAAPQIGDIAIAIASQRSSEGMLRAGRASRLVSRSAVP